MTLRFIQATIVPSSWLWDAGERRLTAEIECEGPDAHYICPVTLYEPREGRPWQTDAPGPIRVVHRGASVPMAEVHTLDLLRDERIARAIESAARLAEWVADDVAWTLQGDM